MLLRALRPDSGSITFTDYTSAGDKEGPGEEIDVLALGGDALMEFRKKIQFVFQDPFSSLNPRMTVGEILAERSEEHTSELQSLMRISYAVFCLKKKQNK